MSGQIAADYGSITTITALPNGIHEGIPAEVYHRKELGVVNCGALKELAKTPKHYRAWLSATEQHETPALLFGRALHALVLEPDLFAREWAQQPEFGDLRTKAGKERRDDWLSMHRGVTAVSADDWQRLQAMRDAVMAHPIAGKFFTGGRAETTTVWTDPRTGLLCKARQDYRRDDLRMLGDLKSTEDASPKGFAKSIVNFRYHVQHAHYTDGDRVLIGEAPRFLFCAVEKTPPYAVGVYMLDADAEGRGHELRDREMDTLNSCLETDEWPSYPEVVNTLSLPGWAFTD